MIVITYYNKNDGYIYIGYVWRMSSVKVSHSSTQNKNNINDNNKNNKIFTSVSC